MKRFYKHLHPPGVRWRFCGIFALLCLITAWTGLAQSPGASPSLPQPALTVSIEALCQGETLHSGDTLHAPAEIFISANIATAVAGRAGDSVTIDFFANTNKLGSAKSTWHDAIRPDPHSRKAQPMIMVAAGFGSPFFVWSNAPAGSYALTARASGLHGLSAVSSPVNITVLPSLPPQTVKPP